MSFELFILDFIQNHLGCGFMDTVMPAITKLGDGGIPWIASAVTMFIIPKTRKTGAAMTVSLALEVLCCNIILKPLVARIRPCDVNTAFTLLIPRPADYGFPSGHTGAAFAAVSALFFSKSRRCIWIPAGILAILVAFSRLYLYVHYPSDVLVGALLGIMLGWFGSFTVKLLERKYHAKRTFNPYTEPRDR